MSLLVLDTHTWLWVESAPNRLSADAVEAIAEADQLGVCTVSCWEVAMLVAHRRIALDRPVAKWLQQALARSRVESVPLTAEAAIEAAALPLDRFPRDPADRFIYATTHLAGGRLVTRDERLRAYDPVLTLW